jgi:hypothetical protein
MLTRTYIPLGCTQQGRLVPTKLTERHLQLRIADKQEHRALGDLLLASGAVEGPFRRTRPAVGLWQRIKRDLRELCTRTD